MRKQMMKHFAQSIYGECRNTGLVLMLSLVLATLFLGGGQGNALTTQVISATPDFGPNVTIITPTMSEAQIEAALTALSAEAEFSTNRYAVLFQPGTYTVQAPIGFYETIAGLGQTPGQVIVNGFITPNFGTTAQYYPGTYLTTTFWRSMENLTFNVATNSAQNAGANTLQWGVSQGTSFRRMQVNGALELTDSYCGEASGGFTGDSVVTGQVNSCSQQQWYTRNSSLGSWTGSLWNFVFSGVSGAPTANYPANSYTVLPTTPSVREKPFLYVDSNGNYYVYSPSLRINSSGTSWSGANPGPGTSLPISQFLIATPATPLSTINAALSSGQSLILTPGIYQYAGAIDVTQPNTVVLGLGYATLVPQTGTPAITVADVDGVQIAGLMFDAGPVNSPSLLQVGVAGTNTGVRHASNPTSISDVFFRIGGSTLGTATESLEVDSDDAIIDNTWIWRADHGNAGTVGWTINTAANGLVVNGDYVTALGLAVEHYQQNQVVWNGQAGETIFYQSELPYDVPGQSAWMSNGGNGYASYYVDPNVTTHTTFGMGVYSFFNQGIPIVEASAISVPNTPGVTLTDSVSVFLSGSGSITHTIDNAGTSVQSGSITSYIPFYQGAPCTTNCVVAPASLTAMTISSTEVDLAWNPSTTAGVTYTVYRSKSSGFAPSAANQLIAGLSATSYKDVSVLAGNTYYYVVAAQTLTGLALSNQASASTAASGGVITSDVFDINAGGAQVTGTLGANWLADQDYVGGSTATDNNATIPTGMVNAAPLAVYQSNRWGTMTYTVPGLSAGASYIVDLHFDESYFSNPGQRQFNVLINGTQVLTNFDIVATAGGKSIANVQSFNTTADSTGTITIKFTAGAVDNPLICGIEIGTGGPLGSPTGPNPPSQPTGLTATVVSGSEVDLSWTASATSGVTYSVYRSLTAGFKTSLVTPLATGLTGTTYKDTGVQPATTYFYLVQAADTGGTINSNQATATTPNVGGVILADVLDINAAGPAVSGTLGANWNADEYFTGGTATTDTAVAIPVGLVNAAPLKVYQSNRYGTFTYALPGLTPNGSYIVDLHFEENYWSAVGKRVFNVTINGSQVLKNFDIFKAAGANHTANVQSFSATADANGKITIQFGAMTDNPLVCGIEVGTGLIGNVPSAPSSLNATAVSSSEVDLSWQASATSGATYNVYRTTTAGFTPAAGNLIESGQTGTTFDDMGLTASTTYYYAVEALSSSIPSVAATASATTLAPSCVAAPSVPAALHANTMSDTEVDLTWPASTAGVGCTVTYNIYGSTTSGFTPSSANQLNGASLSIPSFASTGLSASTTYYYVVEAVDQAGSSVASASAVGITLATGNSLWSLTWGDDFTGTAGTTYDHTKWWNEVAENTGNTWGDGTIQSTSDSPQNVYQDGNGNLVLAMTYNPNPGAGQTAYTSARLHSVANIGYGKIEARIQNPSAVGMGAAFWAMGSDLFLPGTHNSNGATPWPWCGELDMMELQSSNPAHNGSTIHGGETDGGTNYEYGGLSVPMDLAPSEPNFDQSFHTVTTLWGPYHVQYFMDGVQYGDVNLANLGATDVWPLMGPSDNYTLNLILSSGAGGNGGTPNGLNYPSNYTINYVHYSQWTGGVPSPVTSLTASHIYSNAVQLNWGASPTAGVTYNIYAGATPNAKLDLTTLVEQNTSTTSFLAAGLVPNTTYYFTVVASNWGGESNGAYVTATTLPLGNSTQLQLSAGGYAVGSYISSQYVLGGNTNYHYNNVVDTSLVSNPAPQGVYDTERWGAAAWTITGLNPNAGYNVRLHFVEAAHNGAGMRNFNVTLNSATVLNNFDIFATAGAMNKAVTQEFYTKADENGIIELQTQYGNSSATDLNPTISAIEIFPVDTGNPPAGSLVGATPGSTSYLAINSGGGAVGTFVADEDFNGGDAATSPNTVTLGSNSAPEAVYQSSRYVPFTYVLTGMIADAPYDIKLHFAETYWTQPGQRIFSVLINGAPVLSNLDLFVAAGGQNIAYDPRFSATADMYGQIIVQFTYGGADQPTINGIEAVQQTLSAINWATPTAINYGTPVSALQLNASSPVAGTFNYTPALGAILPAGPQTLSVTFTPSDPTHYSTASAQVTLQVNPTTLTVTANNVSKIVGAANPTLTASFSGFMNGDTTAALKGSPAFSTTATTSSPVGTYPIQAAVGTLNAADYTFTFVNGTLSVLVAPSAVISTTTTLTKVASGYQASVKVSNTGTGTASNLKLTAATLGSASGSTLSTSGVTVAAGGSTTFLINFPASAGVDGATVVEKLTGTYSGGSFSSSLRAQLP